MDDDKPYSRRIEAALPRTVFDARNGTVRGYLDTYYRGGNGGLKLIDTLEIDPQMLVLEYPGRCLTIRTRNPDMPQEQAIEIALRQWALELVEKE